jgi:ribosomal protein S18 acetylase RimI-like enzyme
LEGSELKPDGAILLSSYFKLIFQSKRTPPEDPSVKTVSASDFPELAKQINASYKDQDIVIDMAQLLALRGRPISDPALWVMIRQEGKIVASGIAECDLEVGEGSIEWLQVLPEYQKKGYGRKILQALLHRLAAKADFVTVSGRMDENRTAERLYRSCGFEGNKIWDVYKVKSLQIEWE